MDWILALSVPAIVAGVCYLAMKTWEYEIDALLRKIERY